MQVKDISDEVAIQAARDAFSGEYPLDSTLDLIAKRTGAPRKVIYRKLERLNDKGILDCGASVGSSWVNHRVPDSNGN